MRKVYGDVAILKARPEDASALAGRLRPEDCAEVLASGHRSVEGCLDFGIKNSVEAYTVFLRGVPVAAFGISVPSLLGPEAHIWFLGCPEMARIKKTFLKLTRVYIAHFHESFPCLWNIVDSRYGASVKWLAWCGARFVGDVMLNGVVFSKFALVKGD